jgi:dUTP pyrophosphatase
MLTRKEISESGIFPEGFHESQLQPAGMDITLKEAYSFRNAGKIDFDNKERKISDCDKIEFKDGEITLAPGAYKVVFREYVKIPADCAGLCLPRSSLLRCGMQLSCAVWDPGYEGRSEALLVVVNPHGAILKEGAKIGQMVFFRLAHGADALYSGRYKGENK